ncbi:MAG: peptidase domain-containing ABC transporter, partial [Paramuribaculum sp.]|nr:peptidase domain-containing ABC transporter [Paramuribaculum sp.]
VLEEYLPKKDKYRIVDPSEGRLKISADDFRANFLGENEFGIVMLMEPTDTFYANQKIHGEDKTNRGLIRLITKAWKDNKKILGWAILFTMLGVLADVTLPFVFQRTVDEGIAHKDISLIWLLVFGQLFVFLGNYVSNALVDLMLSKLGLRFGIQILNEYLSKLVQLPISFFSTKVNSDLIQKAEDHHRIKGFLLTLPDTVFLTTLNLVVFSTLLIVFSPLIFLIFIAFTSASLLWTVFFLRFRKELDYSLVSKTAENRNNLYELIEGIEEIKSNNAHHSRVRIWYDLQDSINRLTLKSTFYRLYQSGGNTLLVRIRDIVITGLSACMVVDGSMSIGIMMTISYIVGRLSVPFSSLLGSINNIQDATISYSRIEEIHNTAADASACGNQPFELAPISFEDVSFKYPGANCPQVLSDVSFVIRPNHTTAIVGESGCGKSTIIKLLLRFYLPGSGRIVIGDTDIACVSDTSWASNVAAVLQNGKLFSGSILANISLSDEKPDREKAMFAARAACIDEFINTLPMGLNTRIGKTGLDLSGGQTQRILIARAIYKRPEVLILDEATSSLDAVTEARIMSNIYSIFRGKTLVVAAHRLSTVRNADNIVVFDSGHITEQGTHHELLSREGVYRQLVQNQMAT